MRRGPKEETQQPASWEQLFAGWRYAVNSQQHCSLLTTNPLRVVSIPAGEPASLHWWKAVELEERREEASRTGRSRPRWDYEDKQGLTHTLTLFEDAGEDGERLAAVWIAMAIQARSNRAHAYSARSRLYRPALGELQEVVEAQLAAWRLSWWSLGTAAPAPASLLDAGPYPEIIQAPQSCEAFATLAALEALTTLTVFAPVRLQPPDERPRATVLPLRPRT